MIWRKGNCCRSLLGAAALPRRKRDCLGGGFGPEVHARSQDQFLCCDPDGARASKAPTQPDRNIQKYAIVRPIITTVVVHATQLNSRRFTYSPISSCLLISSSIKIRTKGSTIPFTTCDSTA